jgi:hypothetical protein
MELLDNFIDKWQRNDFHFKMSVCKSALRILAGLALSIGSLGLAGIIFIIAEVLGVVEEL